MGRQAATSKGLLRRLGDLQFNTVEDRRVAGKVAHSMELILRVLVFGIVTATRSVRDVENRTLQVAAKSGAELGITSKIADNTFGKVLPRVEHSDLTACLSSSVSPGKACPTPWPESIR